MDIQIELYPEDKNLVFDLMGEGSVGVDTLKEVMDGLSVQWKGGFVRKDFGGAGLVTVVLTLGTGIVGSVVANWLYDRLKGRAKRIRIERQEIEVDKGEITKLIQERIEIED